MKLTPEMCQKLFKEQDLATQRNVAAMLMELASAKAKHPTFPQDHIHAAAVVVEESGELIRAALQVVQEAGQYFKMHQEAIQTGAMAIRFLNTRPAVHVPGGTVIAIRDIKLSGVKKALLAGDLFTVQREDRTTWPWPHVIVLRDGRAFQISSDDVLDVQDIPWRPAKELHIVEEGTKFILLFPNGDIVKHKKTKQSIPLEATRFALFEEMGGAG